METAFFHSLSRRRRRAESAEDVVDRIYETGFFPERWPQVLDDIIAASRSASGAILGLSATRPPRWMATERTRDLLDQFMTSGLWRQCEKPACFPADYPGFLTDIDFFTPEQAQRDPVQPLLATAGLGWQSSTAIAIPGGDMVGFTFERSLDSGRHETTAIAFLDRLRPHLARASMVSLRLGFERARAAVATLESIGLPAAVIGRSARLLATNDLFEAQAARAHAGVRDRLRLVDARANLLLRETLDRSVGSPRAAVSIPLPADAERTPAVLHLVPVRGDVHDLFTGGTFLAVMTPVGAGGGEPDTALLRALFDLTPREAMLAACLSRGRPLANAAAQCGIRVSTARSYLERIFRKTGAHSQAELVALLTGVGRIGA